MTTIQPNEEDIFKQLQEMNNVIIKKKSYHKIRQINKVLRFIYINHLNSKINIRNLNLLESLLDYETNLLNFFENQIHFEKYSSQYLNHRRLDGSVSKKYYVKQAVLNQIQIMTLLKPKMYQILFERYCLPIHLNRVALNIDVCKNILSYIIPKNIYTNTNTNIHPTLQNFYIISTNNIKTHNRIKKRDYQRTYRLTKKIN